MKENLIINFYVTYKCNLSCNYCEVFDNTQNQIDNYDLFFSKDFQNFLDYFSDYDIDFEFFGWEPLLQSRFIKKFCLHYWERFGYKITTNGVLLDDSLTLFKNILLSVHNTSILTIQDKLSLWHYDVYKNKIAFTYVIDKDNIDIFYGFSELLRRKWFEKVNILPVFWRYNWSKEKLNLILDLVSFLQKKWFTLDFLGYENNKTDLECSIDSQWNITSFTGEYIYNDSLKDSFSICNIQDFDKNYYQKLLRRFYTVNSLSISENAKICNVYWDQTPTNFLLLNKFLILLKNKNDT